MLKNTCRALCILGFAALGASACDDQAANSPFLSSGESLSGFQCDELISQYTTWAYFRAPVDPIACGEGATSDVWFLSDGGANAQGEVYCTLPSDVSLVIMSPQNSFFGCPEVAGPTECDYATDALMESALADRMPSTYTGMMTIDGQSPPDDLEQHKCAGIPADLTYDPNTPSRIWVPAEAFGPGQPPEDFDCSSPWQEGNECGVPAGPRRAIMGGGFFVLRPLSEGEHVLQYTNCEVDADCYDYTIYLTVVPREAI